jgi:hypothetical protein
MQYVPYTTKRTLIIKETKQLTQTRFPRTTFPMDQANFQWCFGLLNDRAKEIGEDRQLIFPSN